MPIPVVSPISGMSTTIQNRYTRLYNNPHFDYLSEMLPKDIHELFQWCEIVHQGMPVIANGIRKLINYPVTDFSFDSDAEKIRTQTRELTEKLKLKSILLEFGCDYYVYGNVFRTVYLPFRRMIRCTKCHNEVAVAHADFRVRSKHIELKCPTCGGYVFAELHDIPTHDLDKIRIVRWDPKQIELRQNSITGRTDYYYNLTKDFVNDVMKAEKSVFIDTPKIFIESAIAKRNVKMGTNFFHAKTTGLAGFASGWGVPPLMSTLKTYMYVTVLRRAAEAIGMEHITPQRILFPQASGSTDPAVMTSMARWRTEVEKAIEHWRMDPNYTMLAPYPTGITNIGSQGRNLMPTEEIKDARIEMALALDIPPGLIMGDTNLQNSAVSLRILENQLTPYVEQLTAFTNWIVDCINAHTGKKYCDIKLIPFKLADDLMNKQILMSSMGQLVSKATLQEALNLDPDRERKRLIEDQLADHESQKEVEQEVQRREENAAAQAQAQEQEMMSGMPSQYNQQKMLAQAQEIAMQLLQVPYEERKSQLMQLQNEDYIMWAVVSKQLDMMREQQKGEQPPQ